MTEGIESRSDHPASAAERRTVESPPYDDRRNRAGSILAWVGIVAGVVFIVAVVFFSGFFIGRSSSGNFRDGYHQPGMMMGPSQMGPGQMGPGQMGPGQMGPGQMGPGQMGPGGMMGPNQWPTTTTAPTTPRP